MRELTNKELIDLAIEKYIEATKLHAKSVSDCLRYEDKNLKRKMNYRMKKMYEIANDIGMDEKSLRSLLIAKSLETVKKDIIYTTEKVEIKD